MQLYAVAYRKRIKGTKDWEIIMEYLHAEDSNQARILFTAGNTRAIVRKKIKIIGIGPAIGFKGLEERPQVLLA
jgi:hypothetical protein